MRTVSIISAALLALHANHAIAKDVSVADFGLHADGVQNATPYVRQALEALRDTGGTWKSPKGVYHFSIDGTEISKTYVSNNQDDFPKWAAMPMHGLKQVTVDGEGSLFLFHHRMTVF
ncbi:MAG: hypothetical protein ABIT37_13055 [Luteolibacter sp.]